MKALLIIDMQKALFRKGKGIFQAEGLIENIHRLISQAESRNAPVVIIRHCNDSFLQEGTPDWQAHDALRLPDPVIWVNKRHDSCFDETGLHQALQERGVCAVVLTGLVTQGCVRASCLDALNKSIWRTAGTIGYGL